jgi:hypothetical protein
MLLNRDVETIKFPSGYLSESDRCLHVARWSAESLLARWQRDQTPQDRIWARARSYDCIAPLVITGLHVRVSKEKIHICLLGMSSGNVAVY